MVRNKNRSRGNSIFAIDTISLLPVGKSWIVRFTAANVERFQSIRLHSIAKQYN